MIDSPHKPSDALKLKAEIARRGGRLRYIINTEPHGDHWTGNAFFDVPVIAHEGVRTRILETDLAEHVARVATFGPEEAGLLENYRPNAPVITFKDGMTLHVGNHTFEMIHMPGHTAYQAAVCVKEEGVVFTSDNIFTSATPGCRKPIPMNGWSRSMTCASSRKKCSCRGHGPVCGKGLPRRAGLVHQGMESVCPEGS
jgi:cyclase